MSLKNFVVKNGLTVGAANIDAASGNLFTGNANLGNLAAANFFSGNANALFNIQGANVTGQVANATVAGTVTFLLVDGSFIITSGKYAETNVLSSDLASKASAVCTTSI